MFTYLYGETLEVEAEETTAWQDDALEIVLAIDEARFGKRENSMGKPHGKAKTQVLKIQRCW